ncbi:hypothetical protein [Actinoplanes sp. NPDC051851]|uniref:hypothetical protein n=1 Tax=Actinoplanes sp. NPDC051851 TaxID=3154753 RepID=UPI0034315018
MSILATDAQHTGHRAVPRLRRWAAVLLVALTFGAMTAAAGAWLGWRGAPDLPTDDRATAIAAEILPGLPVDGIERFDVLFGQMDPLPGEAFFGYDEYDPGAVWLTLGATPDLGAARSTLERSGWTIGANTTADWVTASRGPIAMMIYRSHEYQPTPGITFFRPEPSLARVLALVGWVAGLLLGGWIALRFTRHPEKGVARTLGRAGSVLQLITTLAVTEMLFRPQSPLPPDAPGALWEPYLSALVKPLMMLGVACWLLAAVFRFWPRGAAFLREWTRLLAG